MAGLNTNIPAVSPTHLVSDLDSSIIQQPLQGLIQIADSTIKYHLNLHATSDERELLDAMEAQINAAHRASIIALRYRRNQMCIMNRLPDEVLLMILLLCREGTRPRTWEMLRYIHLTWVCRRWRLLALNHAEMWTLIDLSYPWRDNIGILEEFMRRSKGAKLSVAQLERGNGQYHSGSSMDEEMRVFRELIGPNFGRLESLDLHFNQKRCENILPLMKQPAPFLRRCDLTQGSYRGERVKSVILPDLFGGTAQLRELVFQNVHTSWDTLAPIIQDLRTLKLIMKKSDIDTARPTTEQIFHLLEACPELEILHLENYIPMLATNRATALSTRSLTMTRLSDIFVHSKGDASVIGHLKVSVLKQLYIEFDGKASTNLIDDIARCIDLSALREMAVGAVNGKYHRQFGFRGAYEECNITDVPIGDSSSGIVPLQIMCSRVVAGLGRFGRALMARAINVSTLTLQGGGHSDESLFEAYKGTLRHVDSVRNLIISNQSDAVSLLEELADPSVCPDLESLAYKGCEGKATPGKMLVSLAKARQEGSAPINHIKLVRCPQLHNLHIGKLKKLGVDAN